MIVHEESKEFQNGQEAYTCTDYVILAQTIVCISRNKV